MVQEVLPGDSWKCNSQVMLRFAPLIAPIMHRVNCYVYNFFVPNRLVDSNCETFITGGKDGLQQPLLPSFSPISLAENDSDLVGLHSLMDYMGFPVPPNDSYSAKLKYAMPSHFLITLSENSLATFQ